MKQSCYCFALPQSVDFAASFFVNQIQLQLKCCLVFPILCWSLIAGFQNNLAPQPNPDTNQIIRLKWINFSPYTKPGQNPNNLSVVPEAQIIALLDSLRPWVDGIRTFGTQYGLEKVPQLAKERGFKVIVGIWLGKDTLANALQVANGIAIANAGYADRIIVGSEVLLRGDLTSAKLVQYINEVKQACPDSIPVSCADVYQELCAHPEVVAVCDFVSPNIYPFWEGVPVACAMQHFHQSYLCLLPIANGKEILISESGWRTSGQANGGSSQPSLESAIRYNRELLGWSKAFGIDLNIFSAFDEPWKGIYDDGWGLFFSDATLKPGMDTLFKPFTTIDSTWLCKKITNIGADTLVFDFIPPIGSGAFLKGHVNHVIPCDYKIAIYIKVNNGWWIKPTYAQPTVPILCDGTWTADYVTGGNDASATDICVFLVPADFDTPPPPNCGGCTSIPSIIYQNAIASNCIHRYVLSPVTASANPGTICWGSTTTLIASGGTFYLWSTGETTASIQVAPTYNTNYTVTITDGIGGGAIATTSVTVINTSVSASASPSSICLGGYSTLTVIGGVSYLWDTGDTTASIEVMPDTTTTYSVTVTDVMGCTKTTTVKVYVNIVNGTIIANSNQTSICKGKTTTLYGQGGSYYLWSTGKTTSSIQISPIETTDYSVTITTLSGCKDTAMITITVLEPPTATVFANPGTICKYDTATLTAGGGIAYKWSTGDTTAIIHVAPISTKTYFVTVTNAQGCTDVAKVTITVIQPPIAYQVTGGGAYCSNGSGVVVGLADSQNGIKYQLKIGGTDSGTPVSGTGSAISFGIQTATGTYTVVATNTTTSCTNTMTGNATVTVNPNPVVMIIASGPTTFCSSGSVTLNAGLGYTSYVWNTGDTTQTIHVNTSGIYNVTVTNAATCTGDATSGTVVTVNPDPVVTLTADGPTTFCSGGSVTLEAGLGYASYLWSTGHNTAAIDVLPDSTSIYQVTVTNSYGCSDSAQQEVIVNPLPTVMLTGLDSIYTDQDPAVTLVGTPPNGTFNGPGVSSSTFKPAAAGVGQHTIYYSVTDTNGCIGTDSTIVTICATPHAGFTSAMNGTTVSFSNTSIPSTDSLTYLWNFGDNATSIDAHPTHTYAVNGTYTACLIVQNECGADTFCLAVSAIVGTDFLQKPEWAPTIFPNPSSGRVVIDWRGTSAQGAMITIYNQSGQQIYQMEKGTETQMIWHGMDATGNPVGTGIYFFQFNLNNSIWSENVLILNN